MAVLIRSSKSKSAPNEPSVAAPQAAQAANEPSSAEAAEAALNDSKLLSSPKAAAYLGISNATLHRAVKRGMIAPSFVTPGGNLRFSQEALDHYINSSLGRFRRAS
jgi:excisionase family DNA binding protein